MKKVCLGLMFVVIITTVFFALLTSLAEASSNNTINFSARLKDSAGGLVPDGTYNIRFHIYNQSTGGSPIWSENYIDTNGAAAGQDHRVKIVAGYFNVKLGSLTPFGSSVNWDDKLWMTMNIGGTAQNADIEAINWDGEMDPRIELAAVPYAMSAGSIGGKTADQLIQLGQGRQTDASNNASVFINKTGSGNLIQLQRNGSDEFTIAGNGDLVLGSSGDKTISIATSPVDTAGRELALKAGSGGSGTGNRGGDLVLQGGNGGGIHGGGGNVILSGGSATGDGAPGLVIIDTPTFSTTTADSSCYTDGDLVATSCSITQSSVDGSAAVIVGFSTTGQTAQLPEPTNKTAGRILYVIAADDSEDFALTYNDTDPTKKITLKKNTAATMIWGGSSWVTVSGAASNLQDAYEGSGGELTLNGNQEGNGLVIKNSDTSPATDKLLEVQNSASSPLFSVNNRINDATDLVADGSVEDLDNFATNWEPGNEFSVVRPVAYPENGSYGHSASLIGIGFGTSIKNNLTAAPTPSTTYTIKMHVKPMIGADIAGVQVDYRPGDAQPAIPCADRNIQAIPDSEWYTLSCSITTPTGEATQPHITIRENSSTDYEILVDNLSFTKKPVETQNVKVGSNTGGSDTTLFTLDKSDTAPTAASDDALLGSMYYDTTLGKVQCYEADGWGACSSSPDTFVTISPQYAGAVMNGADIGTISSDICSDDLNINDGSDSQPIVCGENETYNFYGWTSDQAVSQTRSIYVTYQLPDNFDSFVAGSTSIMGRTDGTSSVTYQAYRDNGSGLTACGIPVSVAHGAMSSWAKGVADGSSDPALCDFEAGDSIFFRIDLVASDNKNAYVSNINFTFSNK